MKLGFVGVGNIGLPICQNLIKNGHEVHVYDVAPAALERARAAGARAADSPAAVAWAAEIVFTCLPGPEEVEAVAVRAEGVASAARPGLVLVDLPDVAHTFKPGHKLMVQVQSSWFPLADRNPQQFVPSIFWARPESFQKAVQRIHHAPGRASFVELPLVTRD